MPKRETTESLHDGLERQKSYLDIINAQMSVWNDIREKIENDYDIEALLSEIKSSLQLAVKTKANIKESIHSQLKRLTERYETDGEK